MDENELRRLQSALSMLCEQLGGMCGGGSQTPYAEQVPWDGPDVTGGRKWHDGTEGRPEFATGHGDARITGRPRPVPVDPRTGRPNPSYAAYASHAAHPPHHGRQFIDDLHAWDIDRRYGEVNDLERPDPNFYDVSRGENPHLTNPSTAWVTPDESMWHDYSPQQRYAEPNTPGNYPGVDRERIAARQQQERREYLEQRVRDTRTTRPGSIDPHERPDSGLFQLPYDDEYRQPLTTEQMNPINDTMRRILDRNRTAGRIDPSLEQPRTPSDRWEELVARGGSGNYADHPGWQTQPKPGPKFVQGRPSFKTAESGARITGRPKVKGQVDWDKYPTSSFVSAPDATRPYDPDRLSAYAEYDNDSRRQPITYPPPRYLPPVERTVARSDSDPRMGNPQAPPNPPVFNGTREAAQWDQLHDEWAPRQYDDQGPPATRKYRPPTGGRLAQFPRIRETVSGGRPFTPGRPTRGITGHPRPSPPPEPHRPLGFYDDLGYTPSFERSDREPEPRRSWDSRDPSDPDESDDPFSSVVDRYADVPGSPWQGKDWMKTFLPRIEDPGAQERGLADRGGWTPEKGRAEKKELAWNTKIRKRLQGERNILADDPPDRHSGMRPHHPTMESMYAHQNPLYPETPEEITAHRERGAPIDKAGSYRPPGYGSFGFGARGGFHPGLTHDDDSAPPETHGNERNNYGCGRDHDDMLAGCRYMMDQITQFSAKSTNYSPSAVWYGPSGELTSRDSGETGAMSGDDGLDRGRPQHETPYWGRISALGYDYGDTDVTESYADHRGYS